jgi:hypothetical protein
VPCGSARSTSSAIWAKTKRRTRQARQEVAPAARTPLEAKPGAQKPKTRQPWKGQQNTRGFGKLNIPRRSGGS